MMNLVIELIVLDSQDLLKFSYFRRCIDSEIDRRKPFNKFSG